VVGHVSCTWGDHPIKAKALAVKCAQLLDELKAQDILVLDLRELSDVADFFVIATALTQRQNRATARRVRSEAKEWTGRSPAIEGFDEGTWVLLDMFDVVVHLLQPEQRTHYDLEMLWGDAKRIVWQKKEHPPNKS